MIHSLEGIMFYHEIWLKSMTDEKKGPACFDVSIRESVSTEHHLPQ